MQELRTDDKEYSEIQEFCASQAQSRANQSEGVGTTPNLGVQDL